MTLAAFMAAHNRQRPSMAFRNLKSMEFDGVDEYLLTSSSAQFITNPLTLSLWIKPVTLGTVYNYALSESNSAYYLYLVNDAQNTRIVVTDSASATLVTGNFAGGWTFNAWNHFAIVIDLIDTGGALFCNSVSKKTWTAKGTGSLKQGGGSIRVGYSAASANMLVDEVSVWSRALNQSEITELYNGGDATNLLGHSAAANLFSWYRMGDFYTSWPTIPDAKGSINATAYNMEEADVKVDAP